MIAGRYMRPKILAWAQARWWRLRGRRGVHLWQRLSDGRWRAVAHSSDERAELHALRDLRQRVIGFVGDDFTVMPWFDAHRHHADKPYIGCPFCRDEFIRREVTDEMVERGARGIQALYGDWPDADAREAARAAIAPAISTSSEENQRA